MTTWQGRPGNGNDGDAHYYPFHEMSAEGPMGGDSFVDGQSTGLRRRRIGGQDDGDDGAPSPHGVGPSSSDRPPSSSLTPAPPNPSPRKQREKDDQKEQKEQKSVVPLAMHLMRPFWHMSCGPECYPPGPGHPGSYGGYGSFEEEFFAGNMGHGNNSHHYSPSPPRRNVSVTSLLNMNGGVNGNGSDGAAGGEGGVARISSGNPNNDQTPPASDYLDHSPVSSVSTPAPSQPPAHPPPTRTLAAHPSGREASVEQILSEYTAACSIFGCAHRINPGVLTALRFSLPTLRVSGNFFDADMLALAEVLLRHCNGALRYLRRLDFTVAGRQGKDRARGGKKGVRSHGAYALSKVLGMSEHIEEVYLTGNRIGPYGGTAIFEAAARNAREGGRLRALRMRGCRIGERGALAFAADVCAPVASEGGVVGGGGGLRTVDLSANRIGFRGCFAIETALKERTEGLGEEDVEEAQILVDLEGNLVFQEVMNCVTHGLGVLFGTVGTRLLRRQVDGLPPHYATSCAIYSASIIVLYASSTLFHSFFALRGTKFIFQVFDRCAIYLLIAGSYTPFLMIALHHEPLWSFNLLVFIWTCAVSGILVEAFCRTWEHKSKFSLAMYLGMGWSCLVCMPDLVEVVPKEALALMVAGGLAYTGGVPFFVRNNNLDHSIWHMFVLAGSIFHWLCVYWYVAIP